MVQCCLVGKVMCMCELLWYGVGSFVKRTLPNRVMFIYSDGKEFVNGY